MSDEFIKRFDVVIVGAGHAGAQTAIALRQNGFDGSVMLVGDEPDLPYERPPLSKGYLLGERTFDSMLLRPAAFWPERRIQLSLGAEVEMVDPAGKKVIVEDGQVIAYRTLVWAAGGRARRLSCAGRDLHNVHVVRRRSDIDAILEDKSNGPVVIVGGGYIGLEAAAALTKLGRPVTVLEARDRVLSRVAGPAISDFFAAEHRAHGVDVRVAATVTAIEGVDGSVTGVRLATNELLPASAVIVGVGIAPAIDALISAGAAYGDGVLVDEFCQTSLPDLYAVGDCASHENAHAGGARVRLESVQNANDMASTVAKAIVGKPSPYQAVPWFWSDQFDLKLQTVGLSAGFDEEVIRGDMSSRSFTTVYLKQRRVIALDCVNAPKDYAQGKRLVRDSVSVAAVALSNISIALRDVG